MANRAPNPQNLQWATDGTFATGPDAGTPPTEEPSSGQKAQGHVPGDPAPAQYMNWWMNQVALALLYLDNPVYNNWRPMDGGLVAAAVRWYVVIAPPQGSTGFPWIVAGGDGTTSKAYRSTDQGETWTAETVPGAGTSDHFTCGVRFSSTLYVLGSNDGCIVSFASGSGTNRVTGLTAVQDMAIDPNTGTIVALTSSVGAGSAYTSTNGTAWTSRNTGNTGVPQSVIWDEAAGVFAASFAGGEFRTSPDGVTWTVGTAAPAAITGDLATDDNGTIVWYSNTSGTGYYISTDSGATWSAIQASPATGDRGTLLFKHGVWLWSFSGGLGLLTSLTALAGTWDQRVVDGIQSGWAAQDIAYAYGRFMLVGSGATGADGFAYKSSVMGFGRYGQAEAF